MIVLGIDPGYAIVGCGVVEYKNNHFTMLDYGAVTTPAGMPFNIRLERIYDGVSELMEKYKPEAMSIEKLFYNNNAKTVIDVSQARGRSRPRRAEAPYPDFRVYAPAGQTERRRLRTR